MRSQNKLRQYILDNYASLDGLTERDALLKIYTFCAPEVFGSIAFEDFIDRMDVVWRMRQDHPEEDTDLGVSMQYIRHFINKVVMRLERYEDMHRHYIERYGKDCTEIRYCEECDVLYHDNEWEDIPDELREEYDGRCPNEVRDSFQPCTKCGIWTDHYDLTGLRGHDTRDLMYYCVECADEEITQCPHCKSQILIEYKRTVEVDDLTMDVCVHCVKSILRTCLKCDTEFAAINRMPHTRQEMRYCDVCYYNETPYASHQYKPTDIRFHTHTTERKNPNSMFLGLELEFEVESYVNRGPVADLIKEKYSFEDMYIVHDGSLNNGLEVVLHPFSATWYKHNKPWLENLYAYIIASGGQFDQPTVGLHIHTSKAAWTATQIYKLIHFMYAPEHEVDIFRFCGRDATYHSRKSTSEYVGAVDIAKRGKNVDDQHHYNMINLSCNNTIEFRMFQGTDDIEVLYRYIDFVLGLHEFTNNGSLSEMRMEDFIRFLTSKGKKYSRVLTYLKENK